MSRSLSNAAYAVFFAVSSLFGLAAPSQGLAANYEITLGECSLVFQMDMVRLDRCVNNSKKDVDDLHLAFNSRGLPRKVINITNSLFCSFPGGDECFGPAVAPGSAWEGIGGSTDNALNLTIWSLADLGGLGGAPDPKAVRVIGYWTAGGTPVTVPLPASYLLLGGAVAGLGILARRQVRLSLDQHVIRQQLTFHARCLDDCMA
jgi:hypothetical protein